jgi:hypothetical protein
MEECIFVKKGPYSSGALAVGGDYETVFHRVGTGNPQGFPSHRPDPAISRA